jgi:hypothetical protein
MRFPGDKQKEFKNFFPDVRRYSSEDSDQILKTNLISYSKNKNYRIENTSNHEITLNRKQLKDFDFFIISGVDNLLTIKECFDIILNPEIDYGLGATISYVKFEAVRVLCEIETSCVSSCGDPDCCGYIDTAEYSFKLICDDKELENTVELDENFRLDTWLYSFLPKQKANDLIYQACTSKDGYYFLEEPNKYLRYVYVINNIDKTKKAERFLDDYDICYFLVARHYSYFSKIPEHNKTEELCFFAIYKSDKNINHIKNPSEDLISFYKERYPKPKEIILTKEQILSLKDSSYKNLNS